MKTRSMLIGVAMLAALNCAAANAQVLGGVGGGLSGGLRDMSMTTRGTLNGSLGADFDTSTLRRTTRDTAERTTNRARNTTSAVRDRADAKVDQAREKAGEARQVATATTSAAALTAVGAVNDVQIEGAAEMAAAATSGVSRDGLNVSGATEGAGSGTVSGGELPQTELTNVAPGESASGEAANISNVTQPVSESANGAADPLQAQSAAQPERSLSVAGDANGSASASRGGVSAEGGSSLSASRN